MTESEARDLAREINQRPGWTAHAEAQLFINRDNHEWWVQAHHRTMRSVASTNPYPTLPISSLEEWDTAYAKWGD